MLFLKERIHKILNELHGYIYSSVEDIKKFKIIEDKFKGREALDLDISNWGDFTSDQFWRGYDKHFWFKTEIKIPKSFNGKTVLLEITTGREHAWDSITPQLKVYINGNFVQGLDLNHRDVKITECANSGDIYEVVLHAHTGMDDVPLQLNARIGALVPEVENLYYNIKVTMGVVEVLKEENKYRIDMINVINTAINILDLRKPNSNEFYKSVDEANSYIEEKIFNSNLWHENITAHCIGHTHIDIAWRWTVDQTRHKAARSFATVLNLMKDYPEYKFLQSQPQLYKFVKEDEPEIYQKIKEKIKEGRWEADGGMWVEADCNLISGESLTRQFLFGIRYFKNEFEVDNKLLWLPDVFGYSAAMPQILKKCGIDYFVTSKLSWNEYNKIPYDTFNWKGIDGSEILTHFILNKDHQHVVDSFGTSYGGMLTPSQMAGSWQRYQQKDLNNEILHPYGYGDGGGGPNKEMLENAKRMSKGIPGIPKVKMGKARDYLENLAKDVKNNKRLPKWVGELYLEYHRGTYTSMAKNKKYNRKAEFLYQDIEWISSINSIIDKKFHYPQEKLNNNWELILLNQFHDIIPGCSIPEVYETSHKQYEEIFNSGNEMMKNTMDNIASKIDLKEKSIIVFNSLGFKRDDIVIFDLGDDCKNISIYDDGKLICKQITHDNKIMFLAKNIPSKGYKTFTIREENDNCICGDKISVTNRKINNKYFDINLDNNGNITSIIDKLQQRQVLKENQRANVLKAFEDKPVLFDSWDINMYYQEKMWEINDVLDIEVIESGPIRGALKINKKFLDSTIEQVIYVYDHKPIIEFKTNIDWNEKQILLKAEFPIDVNANKATYEIQYGNVERDTHANTSWDAAKFEVCAHKWVDLSEDDYGVSLLNDCKYGHDINENIMRITLLKSGIYPNPNADQGLHEFTYSIYPHSGGFKEAKVIDEAYNLNCPLYFKIENAHDGILQNELSLIKVDKENIVIDVIKKAEDSEDLIIRLYEAYNRRSKVKLTLLKDIIKVKECNLLEEDMHIVKHYKNEFEFEIKPFEIKTFKVKI